MLDFKDLDIMIMMNKFLNNLLNIVLYGLIFTFFIWIYDPNLLVREYAGLGLIAGFFMGMLNEINASLINLRKNE